MHRLLWPYPLKYFLRAPWLVTCVTANYLLRMAGALPDEWYAKDGELLSKVLKQRQ